MLFRARLNNWQHLKQLLLMLMVLVVPGGLLLFGGPASVQLATSAVARPMVGKPPMTNPPAFALSMPVALDAFAHFAPAGPQTVLVRSKFILDLMVNAGSNNIIGQQSYLTFTDSLLQVVDPAGVACTLTNTVTEDLTTFDASFQNEVCNNDVPCTHDDRTVPPASIAYASGALSNPAATGDFRVAQIAFCSNAVGDALIHWQFSPPAPGNRDSEINDESNDLVSNPALYVDYVIHIVDPTATPTSTPTYTYTSTPTSTNTPTITSTITSTNTPVPPTNTFAPTNTPCLGSSTIQGAITTSDPRQRGRITGDHNPSVCGTVKSCPSLVNATLRHYDTYSFTNTTGSAQCVTIRLTTACAGANDIFSVAYLGSFHNTDLCTNYLGDIGYSPGELGGTSSYSVSVPAGTTLIVVVYEITPNAGCTAYTLTVGSCPPVTPTFTPTRTFTTIPNPTITSTRTNTAVFDPTITPTRTNTAIFDPTITPTLTSIHINTVTNTPTNTPCPGATVIQGAITTSDARQRGRVVRDHNPSVCGTAKSCPGLDSSSSLRYYDAYSFTNTTSSAQCVTITLITACSGTNDIFIVAYLGSFHSTSLCTNYMGDIGYSPGELGGTSSYSINVPAGATYVVVVHEITPGAGCTAYTLTINTCR